MPGPGPLVIDVDGTLLRTGLAWEAGLASFRKRPGQAVLALWSGLRDPLAMKTALAEAAALAPERLPANPEILKLAQEANRSGRPVVLISSFPRPVVDTIAQSLGLQARVLASEHGVHLRGPRKREALVADYGEAGFDYAGNSGDDLPIWEMAENIIVVGARPRVESRLAAMNRNVTTYPMRWRWSDLWDAMRWTKTLRAGLALLPLAALPDAPWQAAPGLTLTVLALMLLSAAFHIVGDLADLDRDRQDRLRRSRLFARGALPLGLGVAAASVLAVGGMALAVLAGAPAAAFAALFLLVSLVHAFWLNHHAALELAGAATLDLLRVAAGAAVLGLSLTEHGVVQLGTLFFALAALTRITRESAEAQKADPLLSNLFILAGAGLGFGLLMRLWAAPVMLLSGAVLIGVALLRFLWAARRGPVAVGSVLGLPRAPVAMACLSVGILALVRFGAGFAPFG
ncbi:haloacid dehalogenase-like hydrolase [Anianabacter salinae]|uniref:haloacid dehalogenase-like hydrolase n=1 Tax=Anianabacter salinae TaxID=2851023 RepID=UPI00225DDC61|nr:haloacid dehalogenase-like hydrolase [Anianabacter salinae]MBV0911292.1 haloacid dehalogenase-like hydrolase [Anianabacter salinae]